MHAFYNLGAGTKAVRRTGKKKGRRTFIVVPCVICHMRHLDPSLLFHHHDDDDHVCDFKFPVCNYTVVLCRRSRLRKQPRARPEHTHKSIEGRLELLKQVIVKQFDHTRDRININELDLWKLTPPIPHERVRSNAFSFLEQCKQLNKEEVGGQGCAMA